MKWPSKRKPRIGIWRRQFAWRFHYCDECEQTIWLQSFYGLTKTARRAYVTLDNQQEACPECLAMRMLARDREIDDAKPNSPSSWVKTPQTAGVTSSGVIIGVTASP